MVQEPALVGEDDGLDAVAKAELGEICVTCVLTVVSLMKSPASMKLLGDWNWYLPSWLQWLPHLGVPEDEAPREGDPAAPVSA